jgi:hypothetical protein
MTGAKVAKTLETFKDLILVLWEDAVEPLHACYRGRVCPSRPWQDAHGHPNHDDGRPLQRWRADHSDHLDLDTEKERVVDGLVGVIVGRIEDREETDEWLSPSTSSKATARARRPCVANSLTSVRLKFILGFLGLVAGTKLNDDAVVTCLRQPVDFSR